MLQVADSLTRTVAEEAAPALKPSPAGAMRVGDQTTGPHPRPVVIQENDTELLIRPLTPYSANPRCDRLLGDPLPPCRLVDEFGGQAFVRVPMVSDGVTAGDPAPQVAH